MAGNIHSSLNGQAAKPDMTNPALNTLTAKASTDPKPELDPASVAGLLDAQFEQLLETRINILKMFHAKVPSADREHLEQVCSEILELKKQLQQVSDYFEQSRHCKYWS